MTYRPLEKDFTKKGIRYVLVKREGMFAIYETFLVKTGSSLGYEVICIYTHDGYTIMDNHMEPAEMYPSSNKWGIDGWTYLKQEYNRAEQKFLSLLKNSS